MVRSILRHVQNTLMIMSVLLVMLAFERLQSLDDTGPHKASAPSSLWPHPPYIDGSSPDEGEAPSIRIGSRHRLVFGHELRIGLFRFVLPRLKRTDAITTPASSLRKQFHSNQWGDKSQLSSAQEKQKAPRVAYAVPIESCSSDIIDSARVLQHSLPHGTFYAFHLNDESVQCGPMLKGFRLVSPKEVYPNFDPSCVSKEMLSLLLAHGLDDADVIVYIPLPSLALSPHEYSLSSISTITSRFRNDSKKHKEASMRVASNVLSVQTTRPQGKGVVTRAIDSIAKQCHSQHNNATMLDFLVPWETCLGNQGCHISESISIATFEDCPLPWSNDTSRKATCQDLQKKWLRARELIGTTISR
jgi:hypothetical protein